MAKSRVAPATQTSGNGTAVAEPVVPPEKPAKGKLEVPDQIIIPAPDIQIARVRIIGDAPLICNAFPDKLKRQMAEDRSRSKESKAKNKAARPVRDFHQEFLDSLYPLPDGKGYGFPSVAFKHAMVGACRMIDGLAMTTANRIIFVESDARSKGFGVVRIEGTPTMREDVVRLKGQDRPPDLRYRAEFKEWSCTLSVRYVASFLGLAELLNLIQWAGMTEGVGENRPSSPQKSGEHGLFHVANAGDAK